MSKDALKMNGMPRRAVISFTVSATSSMSASLSITQGPAIRKNGRSSPTAWPASRHRRDVRPRRDRELRGPVGARRAREAREQRMRRRVASR